MNNKSILKLSNIIGLFSIILLVYWVFVFISIQVFDLKVFKEKITDTFYYSIIAILSLMIGALIINIMFNMTRIAEKHNLDHTIAIRKKSGKLWLVYLISFPVIFLFLFAGDYLTAKKKEHMLISSAKSIIENNPDNSNRLVNYSFDEKWIIGTDNILDLYSKTDVNFPNVSVIVADTIDKSQVYLTFSDYNGDINDTIIPAKKRFVYKTTEEERTYLSNVFFRNSLETKFSSHNGQYELFYPYEKGGKKIVLYFSDYQRYGKFGS